jgi:glyoxylase-like metal-dependent hydrolase (beta-lactamase superfamily II)
MQNHMKLHTIEAGTFKLDGGAMFGVVPKTIWNRLNPADENNMCLWNMRCLLVEEGNRKILIDTGMGSKQDEKFMSYFHPTGLNQLELSLAQAGFHPNDITDVFITHLHFDHGGGALKLDKAGNIVPAFPNAKYWSCKTHWDWALDPNPRERSSFLKENIKPLEDMGLIHFIDEEQDVKWTEKISVKFSYGHTEAMMIPLIDIGSGKKLAYCADLLPSQCHIRMPYVMSYDIRPLVTLEEKAVFFEEVLGEGHILFLEHDKDFECCTIKKNERGRYGLDKTYKLADFKV